MAGCPGWNDLLKARWRFQHRGTRAVFLRRHVVHRGSASRAKTAAPTASPAAIGQAEGRATRTRSCDSGTGLSGTSEMRFEPSGDHSRGRQARLTRGLFAAVKCADRQIVTRSVPGEHLDLASDVQAAWCNLRHGVENRSTFGHSGVMRLRVSVAQGGEPLSPNGFDASLGDTFNAGLHDARIRHSACSVR